MTTKNKMKALIIQNSIETSTGIKSRIDDVEKNLELVELICAEEGWDFWFESFDGAFITITIK